MEKFIYDKNNGLWYELQGDYYIPCLKLPDQDIKEIGIWGMRHLEYNCSISPRHWELGGYGV